MTLRLLTTLSLMGCFVFAIGCGDGSDPTFEGSGGAGASGGSGAGTARTSNFLLGCSVATINVPAVVTLTVDPGAIEAGKELTVEFTDSVFIGEIFIEAAENLLGRDLHEFVITPEDESRATFAAVSGVTGENVVAQIESLAVNLDEDTDGNSIPGPFEVAIPTVSATFTAGESGEQACLNFADGRTETQIKGTVFGSDDFELPLTINCRPAEQAGLTQDPVLVIPDATAGQVCFDIP